MAVAASYYIFNYKLKLPYMEKIVFKTTDNKSIHANLFRAENPKGWLLFIHMMPADRESWNEFAEEAQNVGYESLAIDLRGHGESDSGPNGYLNFSDAEHRASIADLEAGWEFLQSRGAVADKTTVIGASIGANLSLQFLTQHPEISGGVLLSPGNYKGIDSALLVKKLAGNQKIIFAASRKDDMVTGNNAEQNQQYYNLATQVKNRHLILFDGVGHGTGLFKLKTEYDLSKATINFLNNGFIN